MENEKNKAVHRFLQLGDGPALRALCNDWMACAASKACYRGAAVIQPVSDEQRQVIENNGGYALYTTGIGKNGRADKKDVSCIGNAFQPEKWDDVLTYASTAGFDYILTDMSDAPACASKNDDRAHPRSLAGRVTSLLYNRYLNGLNGVTIFCFEPVQDNAKRLQLAVMGLSMSWGLPDGFLRWLMKQNTFLSCYTDRVVKTVKETETNNVVLCAEGFGRIYVDNSSVPPFLQPMMDVGKELIVRQGVYPHFIEEQAIWRMMLYASAVLAGALGLPFVASAVEDDVLRGWIGHMMLDEYLNDHKDHTALLSVATGVERLENVFYQEAPEALALDTFTFLRSMLFPFIKDRLTTGRPCRRMVFLMALMIIEGIRKKEKRFHALSSDMEPESLAYAVLSDEALWGEDLRTIDALEPMMSAAFRDLQLLGIRTSVLAMEEG